MSEIKFNIKPQTSEPLIMSYHSCDQIEANLYLGDLYSAINEATLKELNIKRVLSVFDEHIEECRRFDAISYKLVNVDDLACENIMSHFADCNQFIADGQKNNENVLVHCFAGISRSATVVIAFLMQKYGMYFEDAIALVKSKRPLISPNNGFVEQLKLYRKLGYKVVDESSKDYRLYLAKVFAFHIQDANCFNEKPFVNFERIFNQYYGRLLKGKVLHESDGRQYECPDCHALIFRDTNIIKNESNRDVEDCKSIYIEPQKWMAKVLAHYKQAEGDINCYNCNKPLGTFKVFGFQCQCPKHESISCLVFKIDRYKENILNNV